ncbi:MAG TPA: nucleotidyl transferase AbiEii/AbiGii toxin family protein [Mycobacteriales bacterium]|nr:nucleotidyl transferase AbiEii/AbiGii toxin family protein [Mycobacteriales bacterium]
MTYQSPRPRGYRTTAAFRAGLEARLTTESADRGLDVNRLRRQVAFERLLVRLAADQTADTWVLKGGLALELRLAGQCRATRDLDLAIVGSVDGDVVQRRLLDAVAEDVHGDRFNFLVAVPRPLAADLSGRPGWCFPVDVTLAGRTFVKVRLYVVARAEEIEGAVEQITFPSSLAFAGFPPSVTVSAIDLAQHAAEKLHALTREYGDRPNTRVKDLVDLVLLLEHNLLDSTDVATRVRTVFAARATHDIPPEIPAPPAAWRADYAALVAGLDVEASTVDAAMTIVHPLWKACSSYHD